MIVAKKNAINFLLIIILILSFSVKGENNKGETKMKEKFLEKATFAGGCFWCIESVFDELEGVKEAISGYTGGETKEPSYQEVSKGKTGHYEAVRVTFDTTKITYKELVEIFWHQIDPTDPGGQFADRGSQYRTAIFYHNKEQKKIAEKSKEKLEESAKFEEPIVTEIKEASKFYPAEDYHQDYYKTCPIRYQNYKVGSGRESFLKKTWKKVKNKD